MRASRAFWSLMAASALEWHICDKVKYSVVCTVVLHESRMQLGLVPEQVMFEVVCHCPAAVEPEEGGGHIFGTDKEPLGPAAVPTQQVSFAAKVVPSESRSVIFHRERVINQLGCCFFLSTYIVLQGSCVLLLNKMFLPPRWHQLFLSGWCA